MHQACGHEVQVCEWTCWRQKIQDSFIKSADNDSVILTKSLSVDQHGKSSKKIVGE